MTVEETIRRDCVRHLEPSDPRTVDGTTPLSTAIEVMRENHYGCLLVLEGGKLAGIFTERDLLRKVLAAGEDLAKPIGQFMTRDPATVTEDTSIHDAIVTMRKGDYRHLPVLCPDGSPCGVISARGITSYIVDHFGGVVYNLPPDPEKISEQAEGA